LLQKSGTIQRRADELVEWLKTADLSAQQSLSLAEVASAVSGRFEQQIEAKRLYFFGATCVEAQHTLPPDKVKLYFDLLSEVVQNAIARGGRERARLKMRPFRNGSHWGFTYSSFASRSEPFVRAVEGHPYLNLSDALFREGNSGLTKIAALAASILEEPVEIIAERRGASFHLSVPLGRVEADVG